MPTFTYQLLAVLALSAPGLAVLIGFYYSEKPRSAHTSVIISTTPPPPTAFVSLGVVLLSALCIHVLTLCLFLFFDELEAFLGPPMEWLRPYDRLLQIAKSGDPVSADLLTSAIILLLQVVIGLHIGRTVPSLIISGRLPLASVYGWLTPFVAAARDDGKVVFGSVVLKANAKDGLLLGYDGVVASIRLDADFAVKTIVLDPANRFVLSLAKPNSPDASTTPSNDVKDPPSGADTDADADADADAADPAAFQSINEQMRETVPSVTLSGAEIYSTSLTISDVSDYASELDPSPRNVAPVEPSRAMRGVCILLFLVAPMTILHWPSPVDQSIFVPKWTSATLAATLAALAVMSATSRSLNREDSRSEAWAVRTCFLAPLLPLLADGTTAATMFLLIVAVVATLVSSLIALIRQRRSGETGPVSWLVQTIAALAFASLLQAITCRMIAGRFDAQSIAFACFATVAVLVTFALMLRPFANAGLICFWAALLSLGMASQERLAPYPSIAISLLLLGGVCITQTATVGRVLPHGRNDPSTVRADKEDE